MFLDKEYCQLIMQDKLYLTDKINELSEEIANNCFQLSGKSKEIRKVSAFKILSFLSEVKENRQMQLNHSNKNINLIYYLWFDQFSGTLCFNFITDKHNKLPFSCKIHRVEREAVIVDSFLNSDTLDGIPFLEDNVCQVNYDEDNITDNNADQHEYELSVYWEVIKKKKKKK